MGMPLGSVIEASMRGVHFGQQTLNIFHYAVTQVSTTGDLINELDDFLTVFAGLGAGTFRTNFIACMPETYNLTEIRAQQVSLIRSRSTSIIVAGGQQGLKSPAISANISASITLQTDRGGRTQVGGKRMATGGTDEVQNGLITPAHQVSLSAFCSNILAPINVAIGAGQYTPVIWHRGAGATVSDPITSAFPQNTARVMRRRTVGVGK